MAETATYKQADHLFRGADQYAAAKYDITTDWLGLTRREAVAGKRLANVGCGGGEYNVLAASLGLEVVACEPEPGAFALSRAAAEGVPAVRVLPLGLEDFAAAVAPVDLLVMHDVLEHIADEGVAQAALSRLVKPGGEAVLSVPAFQWLFGRHDRELGHHRRYTRDRLVALFRDGWQVLRARYYGPAFVPVTLVFSRWLERPYPTRSAAASPWRRAAFRALCQAQRALPSPFGTSVLIHVRRLG